MLICSPNLKCYTIAIFFSAQKTVDLNQTSSQTTSRITDTKEKVGLSATTKRILKAHHSRCLPDRSDRPTGCRSFRSEKSSSENPRIWVIWKSSQKIRCHFNDGISDAKKCFRPPNREFPERSAYRNRWRRRAIG